MLRALKRIHKDQRGFTLIEVLVVMTILGILAAIVSISLLGVTANARVKAKDNELKTVQAAFDAMLSDQQVAASDVGAACNAAGPFHTNMQIFPAGQPYDVVAGPGTGKVTVLSTHYLREKQTQYGYRCNATGDIEQTAKPQPDAAPGT